MDDEELAALARERFGLEGWRPGQLRALRSVLAGRDVLGVMPTGYGKSAIYQAATLVTERPTVVISPLIALQRDQVDGIDANGIGPAATINSTMSDAAAADAVAQLADGSLRFAFLAPEQLAKDDTRAALRRAQIGLFVVDEAHCVSSWGHDFRPDYLRLGALIDELGHPPVLALTATAAPPVQQEIIEGLHLRDADVVVTGFDRPNLHLRVERFADAESKDAAVVETAVDLAHRGGTGIIYTSTRARAETLATELEASGLRAGAYHGGLARGRRDELHRAFMAGELDVVAATTAFGMGIDKEDVRFVLHADVPDSLDAYYQEVGRAGRDGRPAEVTLFYRAEDLGKVHFHAGSSVDEDQVREVAEAVLRDDVAALDELEDELDVGPRKAAVLVSRLEEVDAVQVAADGTIHPATAPPTVDDAAAAIVANEEERLQRERSRLEMMRGYAELSSCRRQALLTYFGEPPPPAPCGACDNCADAPAVEAEASAEAPPFAAGEGVTHPEWGSGQVLRVEGDTLTVLFDRFGYKTLSCRLVTERGLLAPAAGPTPVPDAPVAD